MNDDTIADRIWDEVKGSHADVEVGGALAILVREYRALVEKNTLLAARCEKLQIELLNLSGPEDLTDGEW